MTVFFQVAIIALAILGSAFYSGLETGIIAINRLRLRHMVRRKVPNADILHDFLEHPDHLLGTTLVGNNLCNVVASVTAVSLGAHVLGTAGYTVAYALVTLIMLVFGEYLPKAWFQGMPAMRTLPFAKPLHWNGVIFYPLSRAMTMLARLLIPVAAPQPSTGDSFVTLEELKHLAVEGEQSGVLTQRERHMIQGVLELPARTCREIMIPRENIFLIRPHTLSEEILEVARTRGVSRLPVYSEEEERFIGLVNIYDVLHEPDRGSKTARDYMRPPQFASAETPIIKLLSRMRLTRQPMFLVHDERSEVLGLVTVEDVLEEVVGEM